MCPPLLRPAVLLASLNMETVTILEHVVLLLSCLHIQAPILCLWHTLLVPLFWDYSLYLVVSQVSCPTLSTKSHIQMQVKYSLGLMLETFI